MILNTRFKWFDLDLVDLTELQLFFVESDCLRFTLASVSNRDWIKNLKQAINTDMFIAELSMYRSKQQVQLLFDKLIENFSNSLLYFASVSSLIVKNQQHRDSIKHMSANSDCWNFKYWAAFKLEFCLSGDENY